MIRSLATAYLRRRQTSVACTERLFSSENAPAQSFLQEMYRALLPEENTTSSYQGAIRGASEKATDIVTSSVTDVATYTDGTSSSSSSSSFFSSLYKNNKVFQRVQESIQNVGKSKMQDFQEKWETSDSPLVHRIQDAIDDSFIMQESEAQMASRVIRQRDQRFDMVDFLRRLKVDVKVVIQAYLHGDENVIKEYCSPEMIERLTGIIKAQKESGLVPDPTLLDTSDVELVDLKMLDESPVIVVQFTCQQINCTRDVHGNVIEGGPEDVQRVYYYWALQQEEVGYIGTDGNVHPPRWQLREMLVRGMHNLL